MRDAAVVDASVAVKWVVDEADSGPARSMADARLEAPDLLLVECANILWKKAGIGDLTRQQAAADRRLAAAARKQKKSTVRVILLAELPAG